VTGRAIYPPSALVAGVCPEWSRVLRRPNSGALSGATARTFRTSLVAAPARFDPRHDAGPDRLWQSLTGPRKAPGVCFAYPSAGGHARL
jgi:hypothetical protein